MSDHEQYNVESDEIMDVDDIETGSTMPLGVEGFGSDGEDLTYGAGGSAAASKGWMVIVTVIVLAAGGLFAMHRLAKVTAGTGGDATVDISIEKFLSQLGGKEGTANDLVKGITTVTTILADDYSQLQVPLEKVQFNPFAINRDASTTAPIDDSAGDAERRIRKQRDKRRAEIEDACNGLRLNSIIIGKIPLANISGRIVRLGEPLSIDGIAFKVTKITRDRVKLTAKDVKLDIVVPVVLKLNLK